MAPRSIRLRNTRAHSRHRNECRLIRLERCLSAVARKRKRRIESKKDQQQASVGSEAGYSVAMTRSTMKRGSATSAIAIKPSKKYGITRFHPTIAAMIVQHITRLLHVQLTRFSIGTDAIPIEDAIRQIAGLLRFE